MRTMKSTKPTPPAAVAGTPAKMELPGTLAHAAAISAPVRRLNDLVALARDAPLQRQITGRMKTRKAAGDKPSRRVNQLIVAYNARGPDADMDGSIRALQDIIDLLPQTSDKKTRYRQALAKEIGDERAALIAALDDEAQQATDRVYQSDVVNMTSVSHYFVEEEMNDSGFEVIGHKLRDTDRRKQHIVNKWERAEDGEQLPAYSAGAVGTARNAEAKTLGLSPADYGALPAHMKMQFAMVKFVNPLPSKWTAFGKSEIVISKKKLEADARFHFGDSSVDKFPARGGAYADRDRMKDDLKRKQTTRRDLLKGTTAGSWLEVNIGNGVKIPEHVEKIRVAKDDFAKIADAIKAAPKHKGSDPVKTARKMLKHWSGRKYQLV